MTNGNLPVREDGCGGLGGCCGNEGSGASRRGFLKGVTAAGVGVMAAGRVAGPFTAEARAQAPGRAFIPFDKKLDAGWVKGLFDKGEKKVYRGEELRTIGMPIGGVAAGQVYLSGDGRLAHWDVFNHTPDTGPGDTRYVALEMEYPFEQRFSIRVNGRERTLDREGFPGVSFAGEYPLAWVTYEADECPVRVVLEAFSPFVPLNAADSALPATVLRYRLENKTADEVTVEIAGTMENAVARYSRHSHAGWRVNRVEQADGLTLLTCGVEAEPEDEQATTQPPVVFEDFEGKDYGGWKVSGEALGSGPAHGTILPQQSVSGWQGKGLVNTSTRLTTGAAGRCRASLRSGGRS